MNDQNGRYARLRDTATGALAALAAVCVIAGAAALAPNRAPRHRACRGGERLKTKTPTPPCRGSPRAHVRPAVLTAVSGSMKADPATGQAVDRRIRAGTANERLASSRFTAAHSRPSNSALQHEARTRARSDGSPRAPEETTAARGVGNRHASRNARRLRLRSRSRDPRQHGDRRVRLRLAQQLELLGQFRLQPEPDPVPAGGGELRPLHAVPRGTEPP